MDGTDSDLFSGVKTCSSGGLTADLIMNFRNFVDMEKVIQSLHRISVRRTQGSNE